MHSLNIVLGSFHVAMIKYSDKKQLKGKGFMSAHSSRLQSITVGEISEAGSGAVGHIASPVKKHGVNG